MAVTDDHQASVMYEKRDSSQCTRSSGTSAASLCRGCTTSLFELVIRGVGGLLSAYDLSGDTMLLDK